MKRLGIALVVVVLVGTAASAQAALPAAAPSQPAPVTLTPDSNAHKPSIGVDTDGTGHVAWTVTQSGGDQLVYCRVPRGATACEKTQTFKEDDLSSFGTDVLVPDPKHVILLDERCCNEHTWAIESHDGGDTFSPPVDIGTGSVVGFFNTEGALAGPGPFSVSLLTDGSGGGIRYQVAPLAGPHQTGGAALSQGPSQWYSGGLALVDSTTPMVAFSDLESTFWRIFDPSLGSSDYQDATKWKDSVAIPGNDEPKLQGGPGGTYLLTHTKTNPSSSTNDSYVVRRFNPGDQTFAPPVLVSDVGDEIFGTFRQDLGGGLAAAWIANSESTDGGKTSDPLRYAFSLDGTTWTKATLVNGTDDHGFNPRIGLAPDHGGWVLYDGNGSGPINLAVVPPGGPAPETTSKPGCPASVKVSPTATALARGGGCFTSLGSGRYKTSGDVRVNGVDFVTGGASSSRRRAHAAAATITVDTGKHTISATGDVQQKAGSVVLNKGTLSWDLDKPTKFTGLDKFHITLLGFPITGEADVKFTPAGTTISAQMQLPPPLNVTGSTTLHTSQANGLELDSIHVHSDEMFIGVLHIKDLDVAYDAATTSFNGHAKFQLTDDAGDLDAGFGFKDGKFEHAEASYSGPPLPFPLATPNVFLNRIGFAVSAVDGLTLQGGVRVSAGQFGGARAVTIDALPETGGGLKLQFPTSGPATLSASGKVEVVGIALGGGYVTFITSGIFKFGANFTLGSPSFGATASVDGSIDIPSGSFYAEGSGQVCIGACAGASAIISSIGIAACGDLGLVSVGAGYKWGDSLTIYFKGCDVGDYKPASASVLRAVKSGGPAQVRLKGGVPQGAIRIDGTGGIPAVSVTGPGGVAIASDASDPTKPVGQEKALLIPNPQDNSVTVLLARPAAGDYTVTPTGGADVAKVSSADGLPPLGFKARVKGKGRKRVLAYRATNLVSGETATLYESAGTGVLHRLGVAKSGTRSLAFKVADGPAGPRSVVAVVDRGGLPAERITLATFKAPGPITPARPRGVRLRRVGSKLKISWRKTANADSYRVRVKLTDGRNQQFGRTARQRTLTIPALESADRATVTVAGVSAHGRIGPAAKAKLKAVKRKTKKRRRR